MISLQLPAFSPADSILIEGVHTDEILSFLNQGTDPMRPRLKAEQAVVELILGIAEENIVA